MNVGYVRTGRGLPKSGLTMQLTSLAAAGIDTSSTFVESASRPQDPRPEFNRCIKQLASGDFVFVTSIDRLGTSLYQLLVSIEAIRNRGAEITTVKVPTLLLAEQHNKIVSEQLALSRIFCAERSQSSIAHARKSSRGRHHALSADQVRWAQAEIVNPDSRVTHICETLGVGRTTLYRYISPDGGLREYGQAVVEKDGDDKG